MVSHSADRNTHWKEAQLIVHCFQESGEAIERTANLQLQLQRLPHLLVQTLPMDSEHVTANSVHYHVSAVILVDRRR